MPDEGAPVDGGRGADGAEARRRRREAVFGGEDLPAVSADERDDADRARSGPESARDRWYLEQRPPHHDR